MKKMKILPLLLVCLMMACDVEGGKRSTSSSNIIVNSTSNSVGNISTDTSISSSSVSISTGLPQTSQNFIDFVNSIVVDEKAGESITFAFELFDALVEWDYPEVLEAYNRLCEMEEEYNNIVSVIQKINLYVEKVNVLPEEITLNDEYLIIRTEDSYSKLDEELKEYTEVISAYEKMVAAREKYDLLVEEALLKQDEEAVAGFLAMVASIPENSLTYSHYFPIKGAIEAYAELSDRAKTYEGVEEAYNKLVVAKEQVNVQDGSGLFDINIIHKATNYECMLDIQGIDEQHKVTGQNKVFNLMVYENEIAIPESAILKWGDAPVATSYTRSNGIHSFSFTIKKSYKVDNKYTLDFIIKTNNNELYAVTIRYMVDKSFTCYGYTTDDFYQNQLDRRVESLIEDDYSEENWARVNELADECREVLKTAINDEHSKMLISQYYQEITKVERIFTELTGAQVIEVSSKPEQIGNMLDGKTGTSWQATSTVKGYIIIDMQATYSLVGMSIMWQNSNAKNYTIKFSDTNDNWDDIEPTYSFDNGKSGDRTDEVRFASTSGRYIRIDMGVSTTNYGFRIFEIYLYQERVDN